MALRVVLADDNYLVREGDAALLAEVEEIELVDSVSDYAIFLLDSGGTTASWNAGAERINGYRAEEILGKDFSIFYPAEDLAAGKPRRELETPAVATG